MTLISLAVIYGYLLEPRAWCAIVLVVLMIPIAIVSNAIRIVGAGILAHRFGPAVAEGFLHEFSGWIDFPGRISFLCLLVTGSCDTSKRMSRGLLMLKFPSPIRLWITAGICWSLPLSLLQT